MVYFYWPETARLSLEEVAKNFGDEVAVHIHDADEEERRNLDEMLESEEIKKNGPEVVDTVRTITR